MTLDLVLLCEELRRDEGVRLKPYIDTVGKVTIGVGRNIQDIGISLDECDLMLANDVRRALRNLDVALPWWRQLDPVRQRVLANMCFNMGIGDRKSGLLSFVNTLGYIRDGEYRKAAIAMRLSKWYRQVGARAERLAIMMETGR